MASFSERMIGAAKLSVRTYEEVEADAHAWRQAMAVVLLSSLAAGIGETLSISVDSSPRLSIGGLLASVGTALVAWILWAGLTYVLGTRLLPEPQTRSDMGELLRTMGFAATPGILRFFAFLPWIGWVIWLAAWFWMLAAAVMAVRQALDYRSTGRAVVVCAVGFVVCLMLQFLLIFGPG
ncbi:MAG: hypothetical protein GY719_16975 [bacterium]|nr:hypothetical protein [bacterium]